MIAARGHLSYSLFQDIKIVGKSLTGICQFIFPMFYGVLPNNIGYIFYGDKRNFLGTADKCLCIGFHIYYVSADVSQFCQEAIPRITSSILRPVPAITFRFEQSCRIDFHSIPRPASFCISRSTNFRQTKISPT